MNNINCENRDAPTKKWYERQGGIYSLSPYAFSIVYAAGADLFLSNTIANSHKAKIFVSIVSEYVPVLRDMQKAVLYTEHWGLYYSLFVVMSLSMYVVGFVGGLIIIGEDGPNYATYSRVKTWRLIALLILSSILSCSCYFFPMFWMNWVLTTNGKFSAITLISLICTTTCFFAMGGSAGSLIKKFLTKGYGK